MWPDEQVGATDGRAHAVALGDSGPALVWAYGAPSTDLECLATDSNTGRALEVTTTDGSRTRPAADWIAALRFDAPSETVALTCARSTAGPVIIEHEPLLPEPLAAWGGWVALPGGMALASAMCLTVWWVRRDDGRRPREATPRLTC